VAVELRRLAQRQAAQVADVVAAAARESQLLPSTPSFFTEASVASPIGDSPSLHSPRSTGARLVGISCAGSGARLQSPVSSGGSSYTASIPARPWLSTA
jgi:hypothetical protein